jgi:membrane peptidoglycan carboxypeptidase
MVSRALRKRSADAGQAPEPAARRRLRRAGRIAKWLGIAATACLIVVGFLWVVTPSAGEATLIAREQAARYRISYPGAPVPENFARALIATEDHRFYTEPGVDPLAVGRVVEGEITGKPDQGGATLEQQLAKMLYTPKGGGVLTEVEQVVLAFKLNATYSKAQILQMYSEVAYYGQGFYGLQAASCGYFGHEPSELTLVQAAMLAGVVNAPTQDDPVDHPEAAHARLAHVLSRMVAVGDITQAQSTVALNSSLGLVATPGC